MKKAILLLALSIASQTYASNMGQISQPLHPEQKVLGTEMTGVVSKDGGVGVQVRYMMPLADKVKLDAGIGMSGGEYSGSAFAGAELQVLEDYDYQPRVSIRGQYENAKVYDNRVHRLGVAPMASKGFNFYGREVFPFLAFPLALNLNKDNTYKTSLNANLGVSGKLGIAGLENLTANAELSIKLKDSYSAAFVGVSYSFN